MQGCEFRCYPHGQGREIYRVIHVGESASLEELCNCLLESLNLGAVKEHFYELLVDARPYHRSPYRIPCLSVRNPLAYNGDGVTTAWDVGVLGARPGQKFTLYCQDLKVRLTLAVARLREEVEDPAPTVIRQKGNLSEAASPGAVASPGEESSPGAAASTAG